MKKLTDIILPSSYLEVSDLIMVNGQLDYERLAFEMDCRLRTVEPYRAESLGERLDIIRSFLEAVTNAERGLL